MTEQRKERLPDIVRRAIWAYVAACAAWRLYPEETTVIPNSSLGIKTCGLHGYVTPCFICAAQSQPTQVEAWISNPGGATFITRPMCRCGKSSMEHLRTSDCAQSYTIS